MELRKSGERGKTEIGWLHSQHSFSFGEYYDPENMGYRSLRVINDDIIEAGQGFGAHPHRDMEIISVVLEGALEHRDSMGNGEVLRPGEVQVMTAGRGIQHSEFNPSPTERTHLIQIWIQPERRGLPSAYGQKEFPFADRTNRFVRVAGPVRGDDDGALKINQDADVYVSRIENGKKVTYNVPKGRGAYLHLMRGEGKVNGVSLTSGDAVTFEGAEALTVESQSETAEVLLFDLK
jgi:redox-sensitive bicupin YhaK (pirin superfamily)